jgi:hypothetical protein
MAHIAPPIRRSVDAARYAPVDDCGRGVRREGPAPTLFVSEATVKTHLLHIYGQAECWTGRGGR